MKNREIEMHVWGARIQHRFLGHFEAGSHEAGTQQRNTQCLPGLFPLGNGGLKSPF